MPIGKIHVFDLEGGENWPAYVRLVEQFILLNNIKDNLRVATLVTHVGAPTYRLMCDLCAPDNPEDKIFTTLVELVKNHLEPKRSEIAERHVFRQRRQGEGENIKVFLQNLKHLATYCNFENQLEVNIRDQFVSGLRSEEIRSRLFAETTLDYKKAVGLALALEAAEQHAAKAVAHSSAVPWAAAGPAGLQADAGERVHRVSVAGKASAAGGDVEAPRRKRCWRCGREGHAPHRCRYKSYVCDKCKVKGHLGSVCDKNNVSAGRSGSKYQNFMETDSSESGGEELEGLYIIKGQSVQNVKDGPYHCELIVENQNILFEIDTGSKISAVSKSFYDQHLSTLPIEKDCIKLQSYTGDSIIPLGRVSVRVSYAGAEDATLLQLFIIEHGGPPLIGRTWMRELKLKSLNLFNLKEDVDPVVLKLKQEFPEVFTEKIGTYKHKLSLYLMDNTPVFCKSRPLPLALRVPVENELKRLQDEGIIYKVDRSDYGTPIVPIIKPDGSIRLCGDYKVTVNKLLKDFHFPLPKIEELFATLSGGEQYSKLDFKNAFMQLELSDSSQPLTAITTHVGTFVYRRAPFGLKCLPEKFQKIVFDTLNGLEYVVAFIDDICVSGRNKSHHLENLRAVLSRLREAGLTIKFSKCEFLKDEVCYLGYRINKHGLYTDTSKVNAITKMPIPENVSQLRALLGFINYYARFIPNLSMILHPLHYLLKKGVKWAWSESCNAAFEEIKVRLTSDPVLAHYSPALPLVLAVDSSAYGLGAVLAQRHPDGGERLVCCASRTLNDAERRYSQVDKEALAIVYGVTRHHQYLFGRHFMLRSDHKALSYIFGPKKGIPQTAASRLQRYAVRLAAYDFNIVFVKSQMNSNADGLSRLPIAKTKVEDQDDAAYLHFVEDSFPLSHKDVALATTKDKILCKVYGYIMSGWPLIGDTEDEKAYFHRRENLHIDHGCIVWGYRIVVPEQLRAQILEEVHAGHVGVVRMKSIARGYVWWPRLDADIEARAASCAACRAQLDAPPRHTPVPYLWPSEPWTRLHVDFLQYQGKYYLLILDSHSKWIEVFLMATGTSAKLVSNRLRECFGRFGLPKCLVSDGGPPFRSEEFQLFLTRNGIKHILIAPYHPSSNGAAENAVKTVKKVIKKAASEGENIERAINNFLLVYRNSTHSSTQREPAVALLGRRLRMRLDLLRSNTVDAVEAAQTKQVEQAQGTNREVLLGDRVLFRDYSRNNPKWVEGEVTERTGAVTYKVKSDQGEHRKHIDQIMPLRKHTRYSNPIITDTDNQTVNTEKETWTSAPNSPVTSSLQTSHDSSVIHEAQSDYAVESSISGNWVNNKPRNRNINNTD